MIEEEISRQMLTQLSAITNIKGYNYTPVVRFGTRTGAESAPATVTLIGGPLTPADVGALGRDHYHKLYHVECQLTVSDAASDSNNPNGEADDVALDRLCGDVVKSVLADFQLGGLALNTKYVSSERLDIPDVTARRLTFDVHFWTLRDDPTQQ